jgi:drug/metabolite transporter (DMT)-like permease
LSALSLAFLRAFIALPVLMIGMKKPGGVKWPRLLPYILSGVLLGFGWLTLFHGFKHTSISSAVIVYNMCPVYVMILAPLILKETISKVQIAVILASMLGLFLIVGHDLAEGYAALGLALSALSGMFYAVIVLVNRGVKNRVDTQAATFTQVFTAMVVLLPLVLLDGNIFTIVRLDAQAIAFTVLLGVLHTGVAYTLFFSVYSHMLSVEIVSYSYLEPLFAILFSVIFTGERLMLPQVVGGVLILGSTFAGEMLKGRKPSGTEPAQAQAPNAIE